MCPVTRTGVFVKTEKTITHQKMKIQYSSLRSGLFAVALTGSLVLGAGSAFAATTGDVTVQGTVDPINEITVTAETGYNTLDLSTTQTDLKVATVLEKNNDADGYTVTLESANAKANTSSQARLEAALAGNADVMNYSMKYGVAAAEAAVTLSSAVGSEGTATVTDATAPTASSGDSKNLLISYTGAWLKADTYSDTLTLTIASK